MKWIVCAIVIFCVAVLAGSFFIKPVILFLAKEHVRKALPGSIVAIDDGALALFRQLSLSNIRIKKAPLYDCTIAQAIIQYTPASIIHATVQKVILKDAAITVTMPHQSIQDFKAQLGRDGAKSALMINVIELSGLKLDLSVKEAKVKAALSFVFDGRSRLLRSCDVTIDTLAGNGFQLENASLNVARQPDVPGSVYVGRIRYADAVVEGIEGKARIDGTELVLDALSAKLMGGEARGELHFSLDQAMRYRARLELAQLDLDTVAGDFKLKEKLDLQGKLGGAVMFEGSGAALETIAGDLSAASGGGQLTIKDATYLSHLARSTNQPMDIIVDSFKNYHYNTGMMRLFLQGDDLVFDIRLEGESGKRDLTVAVHDFK